MTHPLVAPIECLIAYHEKYAKDHASSRWIYGENMMAVQAYKKVLKMIDELGETRTAIEGEPQPIYGTVLFGEYRIRRDGPNSPPYVVRQEFPGLHQICIYVPEHFQDGNKVRVRVEMLSSERVLEAGGDKGAGTIGEPKLVHTAGQYPASVPAAASLPTAREFSVDELAAEIRRVDGAADELERALESA